MCVCVCVCVCLVTDNTGEYSCRFSSPALRIHVSRESYTNLVEFRWILSGGVRTSPDQGVKHAWHIDAVKPAF